jgi:hypothetical protein
MLGSSHVSYVLALDLCYLALVNTVGGCLVLSVPLLPRYVLWVLTPDSSKLEGPQPWPEPPRLNHNDDGETEYKRNVDESIERLGIGPMGC